MVQNKSRATKYIFSFFRKKEKRGYESHSVPIFKKALSNELNVSVSNYSSIQRSCYSMISDEHTQINHSNLKIENTSSSVVNYSNVENDVIDNSTMPMSKCSCCVEEDINSPQSTVDDAQPSISMTQDQPSNESLLVCFLSVQLNFYQKTKYKLTYFHFIYYYLSAYGINFVSIVHKCSSICSSLCT